MADVAHGHGGDGGSQDPNRNSNSIPSICESSQAKKRRGRGRNLKLQKKCEQNHGEALPVEVLKGVRQYKFVGSQASDFVRCISNTIAREIPFHYENWQCVPLEYKNAVFYSLFDHFDLKKYKEGDPNVWAGVQLGVIADCQSRYKSRKNIMKQHFLQHGGYEDVETAKSCCPKDYDPQKWVELIDTLYLDPEYIRRCEANKLNRQKQKYPSYHGSRSYAQNRYIEEKKTGNADYIGIFKKMHYKEGQGWANKLCEADWSKIQDELARSLRDAVDTSASVDDVEVITRALGQRRGHARGVGRVVRHITPDISSSYSPPQPQWQEKQQEMQQHLQQLQQELQEMRQQQVQVQPFSNQAFLEHLQMQNQQHQFQLQQMELQFQRQIDKLKRKYRGDSEDEDEDEDDD